MGTARRQACAFATAGLCYVTCGNDGGFKNDMYAYNPLLNSWSVKTNFAGTPRYDATSFVIGNSGFVGLGYDNTLNYTNDIWQYNAFTDSWTQMTNFAGTAREGSVAFVLNNEAFVAVGYDNTFAFDVWKYTPNIGVGIQEETITSIIKTVYPNPAKDFITLLVANKQLNSIVQIIDAQGRIVSETNFNGTSQQINTSTLAQGTYYLAISNQHQLIATSHFIKID